MQIQYPAYTQPPAFTPPTIDAMGWRRSQPDIDWLTPRGRYRDQRLAALQTTGATVFAVENWVVISATKDIGHAYYPANPQQFINRRDYRARGGGYLNAPWHFWGFDLENLPLPKPLVADAYYPDYLFPVPSRRASMRRPSSA